MESCTCGWPLPTAMRGPPPKLPVAQDNRVCHVIGHLSVRLFSRIKALFSCCLLLHGQHSKQESDWGHFAKHFSASALLARKTVMAIAARVRKHLYCYRDFHRGSCKKHKRMDNWRMYFRSRRWAWRWLPGLSRLWTSWTSHRSVSVFSG